MDDHPSWPHAGLFASSALAAIAAWIFLIGFGVVDVHYDAPGWVVDLIGVAVLAAALHLFVSELPAEWLVTRAVRMTAGPLILIVFIVVAHWIAFGPGPRGSNARASLAGLSLPSQSDWVRAGFGFGAIVIDLIVVRGLVFIARRK